MSTDTIIPTKEFTVTNDIATIRVDPATFDTDIGNVNDINENVIDNFEKQKLSSYHSDDEFSQVTNGYKLKVQEKPDSQPVLCVNSYEQLGSDNDDEDEPDDIKKDPRADEDISFSATSHNQKSVSSSFQSFQSSKENMKDLSYRKTDQINDARLRFASNGYVTIDGFIFNGHADTIGLPDLTWWISQSVKTNANLQRNLRLSLTDKTRDMHKKLNTSFEQNTQDAAITLSPLSQIECDRITSASSSLEETIFDADRSIKQIDEEHRLVSALIVSLEKNRSEYVQSHELTTVQNSVDKILLSVQDIQKNQDEDRIHLNTLNILTKVTNSK